MREEYRNAFPWEQPRIAERAQDIQDEIEELKKPTVLEKPAGIKAAYAVAVVFMAYGLLAESHGSFTFGVFALVVGLIGAARNI